MSARQLLGGQFRGLPLQGVRAFAEQDQVVGLILAPIKALGRYERDRCPAAIRVAPRGVNVGEQAVRKVIAASRRS
jgi:hypothetical protein